MTVKHALTTPPGCLELGPADLAAGFGGNAGWQNMNLKATATTKYSSGLLDLQGHDEIRVALVMTPAGTNPTAGQVKLTVLQYNADGSVVIQRFDAVTLIDTFQAGNVVQFTFAFGGSRAAARKDIGSTGTSPTNQGTIASDVEVLRALSKVEFIWEVTTANNAGTSMTGQGYIFAKAA